MTTRKSRSIPVPERVAAELVALYRAEMGRDPEDHEVGEELAKTVRRLKAASTNADRHRQRQYTELGRAIAAADETKRRQLAESLGMTHHLGSIVRRQGTYTEALAGEPVRLPDAPVALVERDRIVTRSAYLGAGPYVTGLEVYSESTGTDGIPFAGNVPDVERTLAMQPFYGRGLSYDTGNLQAFYRSSSIARESIKARVGMFSTASLEIDYPAALTEKAALSMGINRDFLERIADDLSLEFAIGVNDFSTIREEQVRVSSIAGFSLHEFTLDPGAPKGRRLGPLESRAPNSVMRWVVDTATGQLVGIQQTNPSGYGPSAPFVDARRLVHVAIDRDGNNFEGLSLLRSANMWDKLCYEVVSASILNWQRFGGGVPTIRTNGMTSAAADNGLFDALQKWVNDPQAVLQLPPGATVEMLQMQLDTGLREIVEMCTTQTRAALGNTMSGLAENGVGSYAIGDIKSQLWLKQLEADARIIEASYNRIIRAYVDMFHGPQVVYPRARLSGFAARSPMEVIEVQTKFADLVAKGVHTDQELEKIAQDAGVHWHGRGTEADQTDEQALVAGADPATAERPQATAEPLQVGSLQVAQSLILALRPADPTITPLAPGVAVELLVAAGVPTDSANRMVQAQMAAAAPPALTTEEALATATEEAPATTTAPETRADEEPTTEGHTPPPAAAKAAAAGRRTRNRSADKWQGTITELALSKAITEQRPLTRLQLREIEAYFDAAIPNAPYTEGSPEWQEWQCMGGDAMAEWVLSELGDDVPEPVTRSAKKYAHIDFTPPEGVRDAAKRALEVRETKPASQRGMEPTGLARARDLANGRTVSPETARRMLAFFERHESSAKGGETWDDQGKGWQAWHGWGGDAGFAWARKLVRQMDAADEAPDNRAAHATACGCESCKPTLRAAKKRNEITVSGRGGGKYITHRALQGNERSVAWAEIQAAKDRTSRRITRAVEREQRAMRAEFMAAAGPLIDAGDISAVAALSVDFTARFRQAIQPALESQARWSARDMRAEIADVMGARPTAAPQDAPAAALDRARASAILLAEQVQGRTLEELRTAAVQIASGSPESLVSSAGIGLSRAGAALALQSVSTAANAARATVAAEEGPRIAKAVYSAVMDRYTCDVCADADGTEVEYGSDEYARLSPPNPRCKSVENQGTNMCQCTWIYEFDGQGDPAPVGDRGLTVDTRRAALAAQRVTLLVGPPGAGKSTYAHTMGGIVVDRDDYVLTEGGYSRDGVAASLAALSDAIEAGEPNVVYVACLLTEQSRQGIRDYLQTVDPSLKVEVLGIDAPREILEQVNADRADTERGAIPPEQLGHMLDAWEPPTENIFTDRG